MRFERVYISCILLVLKPRPMKRLITLMLCAVSLGAAAQTVVDVVVDSDEHTTLEALIIAAGLADTFSADGPFTIFAPTDAAFAALPPGVLNAILADQNLLTLVLTYHLIGSQILSEDLSDGMAVTTINGQDVHVGINQDGVFINDAHVTVADITANNGVVHVLDAMLLPPAPLSTIVTLTVDMSNEIISPDGVHVAGSFQGWDPAATPMTDNGDGTWSYTFTSDTVAIYQYKFINGNAWGSDESIPDACSLGGNRQVAVDGQLGQVESTVCFGRCGACDSTTVLFRVDMSNESVSPFGVHVAGDFQGWDPSATELTDTDGDMVYESLEVLPSDVTSVVYKFINGNTWNAPNELVGGACGDVNGNRTLEIWNDADIMLSANEFGDPYCFSQCSSCNETLGCTNENACNFDPESNTDDGSCFLPGDPCEDGDDLTGDDVWKEDCQCVGIDLVDCTSIGAAFWQDLELGVHISAEQSSVIFDSLSIYGIQLIVGEDFTNELVLNAPLVFVDEVTGGAFQVLSWSNLTVEDLPPGVELILPEVLDGGSQACVELTGDDYPTQEGFYEVVITGEVLLNIFGAPFSIGDVSTSFWIEVVSNPNGVPGCTYPTASNYMPWATYDSGVCEYAGCTDPAALNYSPRHSVDDGSCFYNDPNCVAEISCPEDLNGDGAVGTPDLLLMLGEYGNFCE